MLHNSFLRAVYDHRFFLMCEKHANHRCFRYYPCYFFQDLLYIFSMEKSLWKPWSVVIIHRQDFILHFFPTLHGCIHSQVSTFGVAADPQHGLDISAFFFQIFQCPFMGWHNSVAEIKIFLPSNDGIVCTSERNIDCSIRWKQDSVHQLRECGFSGSVVS